MDLFLIQYNNIGSLFVCYCFFFAWTFTVIDSIALWCVQKTSAMWTAGAAVTLSPDSTQLHWKRLAVELGLSRWCCLGSREKGQSITVDCRSVDSFAVSRRTFKDCKLSIFRFSLVLLGLSLFVRPFNSMPCLQAALVSQCVSLLLPNNKGKTKFCKPKQNKT